MLSTQRYADLAEYSLLGRPFWSSFVSQVSAVPAGITLLLQPTGLSIDYGVPLPVGASRRRCSSRPRSLCRRRGGYRRPAACVRRAATVGLALWLAALLPTQSFIPKLDALTNRPLSLALAGLLLAAAPLVAASMRRLETPSRTSLIPSATLLCAGMLFVLTIETTAQRAALFRSDLALWQDAAMKSSANVRPHLQYAALLKRAGRDRDAWNVAITAQRIDPLNSTRRNDGPCFSTRRHTAMKRSFCSP